jgi:hypothetical protein
MEPRAEHQKKTNAAPERWYLRVQGRTVGPLPAEEVRIGLETGEFLATDRVANSRQPAWTTLAEHPFFRSFGISGATFRSGQLKTPPPPALLRARAQPVPPSVPALIPAAPVAAAVAAPVEPKPAVPAKFLNPEKIPQGKVLSLRELADAPKAEPKALPLPASVPSAASVQKFVEKTLLEPEHQHSGLDAATLELERFLSSVKKAHEPVRETITTVAEKIESPKTPAPSLEAAAGIPIRPSYEPIFLAEPSPRAPRNTEKNEAGGRVIQIQLKLPERPLRAALILAVILVALFFARGKFVSGDSATNNFEDTNKTRDLKDSRLPDPSSPTNTPSEAGDPIPPLKAPTRPQRE